MRHPGVFTERVDFGRERLRVELQGKLDEGNRKSPALSGAALFNMGERVSNPFALSVARAASEVETQTLRLRAFGATLRANGKNFDLTMPDAIPARCYSAR
jgi:hypothetical protein